MDDVSYPWIYRPLMRVQYSPLTEALSCASFPGIWTLTRAKRIGYSSHLETKTLPLDLAQPGLIVATSRSLVSRQTRPSIDLSPCVRMPGHAPSTPLSCS